MFVADIAFVLGALVLGLGMVAIHFGRKDNAVLIQAAGWVMSMLAILTLVGTLIYSVKYFLMDDHMMNGRPYMQMMDWSQSMMGGDVGQPRHMMMTPQMMGRMHSDIMAHMQECWQSVQGRALDDEFRQKMHDCMMEALEPLQAE
jgi:hypothetical protein